MSPFSSWESHIEERNMTENPDKNSPAKRFNLLHFIFRKHLPLEKETSLFILASAIDLLMTYTLLHRSDFRESNAVAAWFIDGWGKNGMVIFKFSLVTIVAVIAQIVARKDVRIGRWILNFGIAIVSCVVIYSLFLLLKQEKITVDLIRHRRENSNVEGNLEPMVSLKKSLSKFGQEHVLHFWDELNEDEKRRLEEQVQSLDLELMQQVYRKRSKTNFKEKLNVEIDHPSHVIRIPSSESEREAYRNAASKGEQLLKEGKVAGLLVAGGQGTRLGFEHPKGMFPLGPQSGCTLFEIFANQLRECSANSGNIISWYIMTSDATHDETVRYFQGNNFLGYSKDCIHFFRQGNMPALDEATGKLLMESRSSLCQSPDGHGGMLQALKTSGCLAAMEQQGVEHLFYWQVDNPTTIVCDPAFLGFHVLNDSIVSTKVIAKRSWEEPVGLLIDLDEKTQIIEYINLPANCAQETNADGSLKFWAGNTAIHIFDVAFLQEQSENTQALPFHLAHKKVRFLNEDGIVENPDSVNALKMERFIFDLLPQANVALVVETDRLREFNPVKNASGDDSPQTACRAMQRIFPDWS